MGVYLREPPELRRAKAAPSADDEGRTLQPTQRGCGAARVSRAAACGRMVDRSAAVAHAGKHAALDGAARLSSLELARLSYLSTPHGLLPEGAGQHAAGHPSIDCAGTSKLAQLQQACVEQVQRHCILVAGAQVVGSLTRSRSAYANPTQSRVVLCT